MAVKLSKVGLDNSMTGENGINKNNEALKYNDEGTSGLDSHSFGNLRCYKALTNRQIRGKFGFNLGIRVYFFTFKTGFFFQ